MLIGLVAGAVAIWLGLSLFSRGSNVRRDAPVAAQPSRQSVAGSSGGHEEVESKRSQEESKSADQAPSRPAAKGSRNRKFELADEELIRRPDLQAALNNNLRR